MHACCCCIASKLCPTLCNPMDSSPPVSSVHGISQVRILEWSAIFSLGDLPDPGIKPVSPSWLADSLPLSHLRSPMLKNIHAKKVCIFCITIYFE